MPVIEVHDLTRRFGEFTAVDGVGFAVEPGEIFGFLGPNGAGKSTTISMLCTLLKPSAGDARINGFDIATQRDAVRRSIGLIFQDPTLDDRLTGWQNLQFHALLYDVAPREFERRAEELLDMVELTDKVHRGVKTYSGGMKRRLEIVLGLLHHPRVLFLDEPTIGLDPQTRMRIWEYVQRVRDAEGLTLFLTTHYIDEAEVCDRIAVIDHGRIVACDTPRGLKEGVGGDVITVRTTDDERARLVFAYLGFGAEPSAEGLRIVTARGDEVIPDLVRLLDEEAGPAVRVTSIDMQRPTLDDVFVKLTGRDIREEGASDVDEMRVALRQHGGR
jgi:ABC-2 type transport system ATP-binding protein